MLPSQCRTEASPFPASLVPPQPRSHPNSALAYPSHLLARPLLSAPVPYYSATVRILLRSPINDAARSPASAPPPPALASSHSYFPCPPASGPSALDPCPDSSDSECSALLAPTASLNTRRLLC